MTFAIVKLIPLLFQHKFVVQNAQFLVESVLPLVDRKYTAVSGHKLPETSSLRETFKRIQSLAKVTLGEFV